MNNNSVKRVLIMDDDELVANLIGKMVKSIGYKAETVQNGEDAVQRYKEAAGTSEQFDAVILDMLVKQGIGGIETVRRLTEFDHEVKAILSSGYIDDSVISDISKYGFKSSLIKPYEMKELEETLNRVINAN